jgi:hypothetical protein
MTRDTAYFRVDPVSPERAALQNRYEAWQDEVAAWEAAKAALIESMPAPFDQGLVTVTHWTALQCVRGPSDPVVRGRTDVDPAPPPGWARYAKNRAGGVAWLVPAKGYDGTDARWRMATVANPPQQLSYALGLARWTVGYTDCGWGYQTESDGPMTVENLPHDVTDWTFMINAKATTHEGFSVPAGFQRLTVTLTAPDVPA